MAGGVGISIIVDEEDAAGAVIEEEGAGTTATGAGLELVTCDTAAAADGKYCGNGATPPPNDRWWNC